MWPNIRLDWLGGFPTLPTPFSSFTMNTVNHNHPRVSDLHISNVLQYDTFMLQNAPAHRPDIYIRNDSWRQHMFSCLRIVNVEKLHVQKLMVRMHQHKYRVLLGSLIKMLHIRRNIVDMRLFWQSAEWIRLFHSIKFEFTCPLLLKLRLQPSLLHSPNYPILHSLGWTCRDIVWVVQHSRCCKSMYDKLSDSWSYSLSRQCPWLL